MDKDNDREKFLTTIEAAEYLRLSPKTLITRRTKNLPPRFIKAQGKKGHVLYSMEALREFLGINQEEKQEKQQKDNSS